MAHVSIVFVTEKTVVGFVFIPSVFLFCLSCLSLISCLLLIWNPQGNWCSSPCWFIPVSPTKTRTLSSHSYETWSLTLTSWVLPLETGQSNGHHQRFPLSIQCPDLLILVLTATVGYIGMSQGSNVMFGLLSSKPSFNHKIKPFIALCPAVRISNATRIPLPWIKTKIPVPDVIKSPFLKLFNYCLL